MGLYLAALATMLLAATRPAGPAPASAATATRGVVLAVAANKATSTLLRVYYAGGGEWRSCDAGGCATGNADWGDDSLTYTLALRQSVTHDQRLTSDLAALTSTAPSYPGPCRSVGGCKNLSDKPSWDAVALAEEYLATKDPTALQKAEQAFNFVANSRVYARGACPSVLYQKAGGGDTHVKTLESQATLVKAALLLYRATQNSSYLNFAVAAYNAARTYFLDPQMPLYSVYVFDDGSNCGQLPRRFFASVNGEMIWNGVELSQDTGQTGFLDDATATAQAVSRLSDGRGVFADLQAENDVVEPLVEGMYAVALKGQGFARAWLLKNAATALSARARDGSFGRFFDGPPPPGTVTAWQTNGGLALEIAAGALSPATTARTTHAWGSLTVVHRNISSLPASLSFRGAGIAVIGTLGDQCCSHGHARVLVDGHETVDQSGIWQNKSSANQPFPNTIMFAWRWPKPGRHQLRFLPGDTNAKEGGSYLHLDAYEVVR